MNGRRASALLIGAAAVVALAIVAAVYLLGGDGGGYEPRLTAYLAEALAAKVAHQPSSTGIGCEVIEFREESRQWLVECQQEKKTRWLVNDETQEVRPEGGASGSPAETPV